MEIKDTLKNLRESLHLTQDQMAERVMVSRQAVSRWENGDTQPNTDTLKILSREFDVSINTLLGSPRQLVCQCCGMPLSEDGIISKESDGSFNEDYCKWCYADGTYTYDNMDDLIDVCVVHMVNDDFTEEQARTYMKQMLPGLDYWKRYEELSDNGQFAAFKKQLIGEINSLHIEGLPKVEKLNALVGKYVNLEYRLPGGMKVKFLDDQATYLGNQLESEFGGDRCFGILANMDFILICTYEKDGVNPELVLYKKDKGGRTMLIRLNIKTTEHTQMTDITDRIQKAVTESGVKDGLCMVFIPHTTAAVTINENADPDVVRDFTMEINKIVPWKDGYRHMEGNSAAHLKSSMIGFSELLIIDRGRLVLGTWQDIYFCEYDGPRNRMVYVKIMGE